MGINRKSWCLLLVLAIMGLLFLSSFDSNNKQNQYIEVSHAELLNSDLELQKIITSDIVTKDDNWVTVKDEEYVKLKFEETLTDQNDMRFYIKANENSKIEIFTLNLDAPLITITDIKKEGEYKVFLTSLKEPEDEFYLKVTGEIEFDWIIDPIKQNTTNGEFYSLTVNNNQFSTYAGCEDNPTGGDDDTTRSFTLPFSFLYYGNNITTGTTMYMDTNGRLMLDNIESDWSATDSEMLADRIIAANWQDLGSDSTNKERRCVYGSSPNQYAVFKWNSTWYEDDGQANLIVVIRENSTIEIHWGELAAHSDDTWIMGVSNGTNSDYYYNTSSTIVTADSNKGWTFTYVNVTVAPVAPAADVPEFPNFAVLIITIVVALTLYNKKKSFKKIE